MEFIRVGQKWTHADGSVRVIERLHDGRSDVQEMRAGSAAYQRVHYYKPRKDGTKGMPRRCNGWVWRVWQRNAKSE